MMLCSRAFIRAVAQDPELTVPSPTFLLQLVYDEHEGILDICHVYIAAMVLDCQMKGIWTSSAAHLLHNNGRGNSCMQ